MITLLSSIRVSMLCPVRLNWFCFQQFPEKKILTLKGVPLCLMEDLVSSVMHEITVLACLCLIRWLRFPFQKPCMNRSTQPYKTRDDNLHVFISAILQFLSHASFTVKLTFFSAVGSHCHFVFSWNVFIMYFPRKEGNLILHNQAYAK